MSSIDEYICRMSDQTLGEYRRGYEGAVIRREDAAMLPYYLSTLGLIDAEQRYRRHRSELPTDRAACPF